MAGFVDTAVAFVVIGSAVYSLVILLFLGLARSASLADDEMEAYLVELHGSTEDHDPYDTEARRWVDQRRSA